ncbi:MAG: glycosyltransferase, partial [Pseudomonadota bacterium]
MSATSASTSKKRGARHVTVIVPVYNVEDHVTACLESLKAQNHGAFDVIVVNDGSTDASAERVFATVDGDPRFSIISQDNAGLSAARNAGLDAALQDPHCSYIAFVDSDDCVSPDYLGVLVDALERHPDIHWAACGIRNRYPDGTSRIHSGIIDTPDPGLAPGEQIFTFGTAADVIRHMPSAWNKLYRADFIGETRFTPGTWFEDHAFFLTLARRAPGIVHLSDALYDQTRGRPGQITETDSTRVFDQLTVLEDILPLLEDLPEGPDAASALTCRLLSERSTALRTPDRRAIFAEKARAFLEARGQSYRADPASGASRVWGLELEGNLPLSVIVPWDGRTETAPLEATLTALAGQHGPGFELLLVVDNGPAKARVETLLNRLPHGGALDAAQVHVATGGASAGRARGFGLNDAQGRFVIWLDAGDIPGPWALFDRVEAMLALDGEIGVSARRVGPDQEGHAGFEREMTPAHDGQPALFRATPNQALATDLALSAAIFDRAFLTQHALVPSDGGRYSEWPLVLGSLLMAERSVYLPSADVALNPGAGARALLDAETPVWRVAADLRAAEVALPEAARKALPAGWERRLTARGLRLWLLEGPKRSRIAQLAAQLGAAGLIARRGMGRVGEAWPAGFDPQIGPKFARLFDTGGLLRLFRGKERARLAAGGLLPGEAKAERLDWRGEGFDQHAHAFSVAGATSSIARLMVQGGEGAFANISFYAGDGISVPLHFSFRLDDGLVVVNDTRTDGVWRRERAKETPLPPGSFEITIEIASAQRGAAARLWIEDRLIWSLPQRNMARRNGVNRLGLITHLGLSGAVSPLDLAPDNAAETLFLDSRLQLRAPDPSNAEVTGGSETFAMPLLEAARQPGQRSARATLPARVWSTVPSGGALTIRAPGLPALELTRPMLAERIAGLLQRGLPMGDADLILQTIELVALADLTPLLGPDTQAELARLTSRFDLEAVLPNLARTARFEGDTIGPLASAVVARARRMAERGSEFDWPRLLDDLPPDAEATWFLVRQMSESALLSNDWDAFYAALAQKDLGPIPMSEDGADPWTLTSSVPFLWEEGRNSDLVAAVARMTVAGNGWRVTPALAWAGKAAQSGRGSISQASQQRVLQILLDWLRDEGRDYWGRTNCTALIAWAADLVLDLDRLSAPLRKHAEETLISVYGANPAFWETLKDEGLPSRFALARKAFGALDAPQDIEERARALDTLQHLGVGDMSRLRAEYLGPAGVASDAANALDRPHLLPLEGLDPTASGYAALRHMAFPGTPPASDAVADLVSDTIRDALPSQDVSPFHRLQKALHPRLAAIVEGRAPLDQTVLDDLARLNVETARYLGIGLALSLLSGLQAAEDRAWLADWIIGQDPEDPDDPRQDIAYWRRRAPAVRMGLARLCANQPAEAQVVIARLTALPEGTTDKVAMARSLPPLPALPDTSPLPAPHALNDVIVTVFSCEPFLETRIPELRAGWLSDLKSMGIPYVVVVGNGDGTLEGDVLRVDAPDDYEGLPAKTLATINWVRRHAPQAHMFKIDDDCLVDAPALFEALDWRSGDYIGRQLTRMPGEMDRTWHQAKASTQRGKLELDKSPEPATYADGGSGYLLSRDAIEAACAAAVTPRGRALIDASFMEDKLLGDLLHLGGIYMTTPGYLTAIRRRTFGAATPVAFWNVGF